MRNQIHMRYVPVRIVENDRRVPPPRKGKNMNKHTPGPWKWTGDKQNFAHRCNNWLCGVNEGVLMHGGPWPVSDANARLIAAAPDAYTAMPDPDKLDMLAAWIDLKHPEYDGNDVQNDLRRWATNIRAVIAKVEGEKP